MSTSYLLLPFSKEEEHVERMKEAEVALWKYYDLEPNTFTDRYQFTERWLDLTQNATSETRQALQGIHKARVWIYDIWSDEENEEEEGEEKKEEDDLPTPPSTPTKFPVVLVHGGGGTPGDFAPLLAVWHEKVKADPVVLQSISQIILVERPGNGLAQPMDYTHCDVEIFEATYLYQILQALHILSPHHHHSHKVHLVGNSLGGQFIVHFAQQFPHHVASLCCMGDPAGYQGMMDGFLMGIFFTLHKWFFPLLVLRPALRLETMVMLWILFRIPYAALPSVYIDNLWRSFCIKHNQRSVHTMFLRLLEYHHQTQGWKLQKLQSLRHDHNIPILFLRGHQELMMTHHHQQQIRLYLEDDDNGKEIDKENISSFCTMGQGHLPWFSEPHAIAEKLEDFWNQAASASSSSSAIAAASSW
jgi:pimeloyl-ACP methyl ester carboxylesterase